MKSKTLWIPILLSDDVLPDDDDEDRNRVRYKMLQCFDEIAVHGFPRLNLPPDAHGVDYPYLDDKFRNGLQTVVNSIMERVSSPRYDSNTLLSYLMTKKFQYPFFSL